MAGTEERGQEFHVIANFKAEQGDEPISSAEQRTDGRLERLSQTAALSRDGRRGLVRMVNLSRSGAMIAVAEPLQKDDFVSLQLAGYGEVNATVRWAHDGKAGLHFTRPLE